MAATWLVVCVYIATLLVHSYQPIAMLSWSQRQRRRRALLMISIVSLAAILADHFHREPRWIVGSLAFALGVSAIFVRHLRHEGSVWGGPRVIFFTRLTLMGGSFLVASLSVYRTDIWMVICILCGFWNAAILRRESDEITREFSHLKTRLATLYADRRNENSPSIQLDPELSDNSSKAS